MPRVLLTALVSALALMSALLVDEARAAPVPYINGERAGYADDLMVRVEEMRARGETETTIATALSFATSSSLALVNRSPEKIDSFLHKLLSSVGMTSSEEQETTINSLHSTVESNIKVQQNTRRSEQVIGDVTEMNTGTREEAIGWEDIVRDVLEKKALGVWGRGISRVGKREAKEEMADGREEVLEVRGQMGSLKAFRA